MLVALNFKLCRVLIEATRSTCLLEVDRATGSTLLWANISCMQYVTWVCQTRPVIWGRINSLYRSLNLSLSDLLGVPWASPSQKVCVPNNLVQMSLINCFLLACQSRAQPIILSLHYGQNVSKFLCTLVVNGNNHVVAKLDRSPALRQIPR